MVLCLAFTTIHGYTKSRAFIFGRGGDSVGLDPAHEEDGESFKVCENIYDTLVQYQDDSTEIEPALAKSWEITADGLTWTFHLRRDVDFHDGTPFNADAVLFSLNRQHDIDHSFHKIGGPYIYWTDTGLAETVKQITKVDDYTIQIELNQPYAPFIYALTIPAFAIVSPTALQKYGQDFTNHPVGTGPFSFVRWDRNEKIILKANPTYWGGKPAVDLLVFRSIPENSVRLIELQSGNIHAMEFPNPDDLPLIRQDQNLKIIEKAGMNVGYLALNMDKKPFDSRKVRLAINHAINKDQIIDQLYQGLGIAAKNPIPPNMWGYAEDTQPYRYSPDLARQLMAEAGYEDGFKVTLWALPVPRPYIPNGRMLAEVIQSDLKQVGIQTEIVSPDWGTYLEKTKNGQHDMAMLGWSADFADPDNFLYYLLSKSSAKKPAGNIAFYRSDEMQSVLDRARVETKMEIRTQLYKEAQSLFHRDVPWVPLAHAKQIVVAQKNVRRLKLHPTSFKYLRNVEISND
ncbi:ABC transporter substrate-binding protein [Candidatus Poribacteria bacterium]|nr:ABC transporter substrate-binding protein [Candidatus Poribacteria bacterium]